MMLSFVSGKNGERIMVQYGDPKPVPPPVADVTATLTGRTIHVHWALGERHARHANTTLPDAAEFRITLLCSHAKPDPTAGARGERMFSQAAFGVAALVDLDASATSHTMELPSDADLALAADSMLPDTPLDASRPGANLPHLVRRAPGGELELQLLLECRAISADGVLGDSARSAAIPLLASASTRWPDVVVGA